MKMDILHLPADGVCGREGAAPAEAHLRTVLFRPNEGASLCRACSGTWHVWMHTTSPVSLHATAPIISATMQCWHQ
jgi:hypothetical protein